MKPTQKRPHRRQLEAKLAAHPVAGLNSLTLSADANTEVQWSLQGIDHIGRPKPALAAGTTGTIFRAWYYCFLSLFAPV
jgi:hypothetical protein